MSEDRVRQIPPWEYDLSDAINRMQQTPLPTPLFVAGHQGMVGSAIVRRLSAVPGEVVTMSHGQLDLCDQQATLEFLKWKRPAAIVMAAARAGGIAANQAAPVEFLVDNVRMTVNLLDAAHRAGVKRLLFLGSTCIYPRDCRQPARESDLLRGPLEPTNEAYSLAKITGVKLCEFYRRQFGRIYHSVMPTNLYGPHDNYEPESSHVVAGLLRRFHEAQQANASEVTIWGSGQPRRDFLHVEDLADAIVYLLRIAEPPNWVNVGTGIDLSVIELAKKIACLVGYQGRIRTDLTRPDGAPVKQTDVTLLQQLGWRHQIELDQGLPLAYESFLSELRSDQLRSHDKIDQTRRVTE
ncbi:MAG: GDP-L-fucose synthase [Rubripirellula sp.]|nr:GDP-L-fucose synthase [Rubripirellula sp.]